LSVEKAGASPLEMVDQNRHPDDMGGEITENDDVDCQWIHHAEITLSLLSDGLSYRPVHRFLTKIRLRHCSERQFYRIQRTLVPWLHQQAKKPCAATLKQFLKTDHVGFNGAWNHNRGGSKLIGTLCNASQKSVIGYPPLSTKRNERSRLLFG
jgi:hypothetical protein